MADAVRLTANTHSFGTLPREVEAYLELRRGSLPHPAANLRLLRARCVWLVAR